MNAGRGFKGRDKLLRVKDRRQLDQPCNGICCHPDCYHEDGTPAYERW